MPERSSSSGSSGGTSTDRGAMSSPLFDALRLSPKPSSEPGVLPRWHSNRPPSLESSHDGTQTVLRAWSPPTMALKPSSEPGVLPRWHPNSPPSPESSHDGTQTVLRAPQPFSEPRVLGAPQNSSELLRRPLSLESSDVPSARRPHAN